MTAITRRAALASAGAVVAVEAVASTDEALSALWQEHERLTQQLEGAVKETDLAFTAKKDITETETPEYGAAAAALAAAEQQQGEILSALGALEIHIATVPAHTAAGVLIKLRVASPEITGEVDLSALADLERLAGATAAPPSIASVPGDPLLSLRAKRQQVQAEIVANLDADGDELKALSQSIRDVETRIIAAEPQTFLGALVQLEVLVSMADEGVPGFAMGIIAAMNEQIPARIERLLAASFGEARAIDDPLIALGRQWREAYDNWQAKIPTAGSDEEWTVQDDERSMELARIALALEDQISKLPVLSMDGALVQLRIAGKHYHLMERDGEKWADKYAKLTWQAWDGLERLVGAMAPEDSLLVRLADDWYAAHKVYDAAVIADDRAGEKDPEKKAEVQRTQQRADALYDQMVDIPAQGLRGIYAKMRAAVFPDQWKAFRAGEIESLDTEINTEMFFSLVADVDRLAREGAAAIPAGVTEPEDPILALKREWETRYEALDEQRETGDDSDEARQPFYDRLDETEVQILRTPATTPAGIAVKLILWARLHCTADEVSGLSWTRKSIEGELHDLDRLPVLSALVDLERMSEGVVPDTIIEPASDDALLAVEQRMLAAEATIEELNREKTPNVINLPLWDEWTALQEQLSKMPAVTIRGLAAKLRLIAVDSKEQGMDTPAAQVLIRSALETAERLTRTTTVGETPPTEDAALFDAIAEYDRLVEIEQTLEHRKDILRPGIPEAVEADKAHDAANDKTMEAWTTVRDTPTTTQAGLFAKLQAVIRFMTDLEQDELYEAEWQAIKADVQRIAGEG